LRSISGNENSQFSKHFSIYSIWNNQHSCKIPQNNGLSWVLQKWRNILSFKKENLQKSVSLFRMIMQFTFLNNFVLIFECLQILH
jgi:hypothetical protein